MKIELTSFTPIYEQIKINIKAKISLGELKPHDPIPSLRELASELIINPNTVARAYRELEMEGFIYTKQGKGCFVSENSSSLIKKERSEFLNQVFDKAIQEATKFNLASGEIKKIFEGRLKSIKKTNLRGKEYE